MYRHPMSDVTAATVERSGASFVYRFAVLAALMAVLAGAAPASAQEGFGNYAAAEGASPAEQSPHLNVPHDSRASVVSPRYGHRRSSR
jgi:hypothetical protein